MISEIQTFEAYYAQFCFLRGRILGLFLQSLMVADPQNYEED